MQKMLSSNSFVVSALPVPPSSPRQRGILTKSIHKQRLSLPTLSPPRMLRRTYMISTWRHSTRQGKPSITAPKFSHMNFRQACKSPTSHVLTGTLVTLRWSFVSKIVVLIQSLAKRRGIKSSNPWSPRSLLGISAVCLQALILPNKMLQQMQYLGKPSSKTYIIFVRNST
jgi:hypothetical protein